jgi:hypothetical protein
MRWLLLVVRVISVVGIRVGSLTAGDGNAVLPSVGSDVGVTGSPGDGAGDTGIVVSSADGSRDGAAVGCEAEELVMGEEDGAAETEELVAGDSDGAADSEELVGAESQPQSADTTFVIVVH